MARMKWPGILVTLGFLPVLLLSSSVQPAQPETGSQLANNRRVLSSLKTKGNVTRAVLSNGLVVLVEEYPSLPLAELGLYVPAGRLNEEGFRPGTARAVAELELHDPVFQKELGKLGGVTRLRVGPDYTFLQIQIPSANLQRALDLPLYFFEFPELESEPARSLASSLLRMPSRGRDSPFEEGVRELLSLEFEGKGLGRPLSPATAAGTPAITASEARSLEKYHDAFYRPNRMVLVLAGDVLHERVLSHMAETYEKRSGKGPAGSPAAVPKFAGQFRYKNVRGHQRQPYIMAGYRIPGRAHPDFLPLSLLSYVLGRGRGSLLNDQLVGMGGGVRVLQTRLLAARNYGTLMFLASPDKEKIDRVEVGLLASIEALRETGVTDYQLSSAKALWLSDYYDELEQLGRRALMLAQRTKLAPGSDRDSLPGGIEKIRAADLNRVLRKYLADSNLSLLEYFPDQMESRNFTPHSLQETLKLLVPSVKESVKEKLKNPLPKDVVTFKPFPYKPSYLKTAWQQTSILRGPEIYFQEMHTVPIVHIGFFYPGGRSQESGSNSGITELLMRSLVLGLGGRKSAPNWPEIEQMGARIQVVNEADYFGLEARVLSPYADRLIGILIRWLRNPELTAESVDSARNGIISLQYRIVESPSRELKWNLLNALFEPHPYSHDRLGSESTMDAQNLQSVQAWEKVVLDHVHPRILLRGDFQGTSLLDPHISELSDSSFQNRPHRRVAVQEDPQRKNGVLVSLKGRTAWGLYGPEKATRDDWLMDVVESVLTGTDGWLEDTSAVDPDLIVNLRFRRAALAGGGLLEFVFTAPPGKQVDLRAVLRRRISAFDASSLSAHDFLSRLVQSITRFYLRQQSGDLILKEMIENVLSGEKIDFEGSYLATLRAVRKDDVVELLHKYFPPSPEDEKPGK